MAFRLSKRSQSRLVGVHPDLRAVVELAISLTAFDFGVTCGVRSRAEQVELVRTGRSQTMNSRHLTGHAVDLVAMDRGSVVWDWPPYTVIADAMKAAAGERGCALRWGGAWSTPNIAVFDGGCEDAMTEYVTARRSQGRKPFLDGPHFELPREVYGDENPALHEAEA